MRNSEREATLAIPPIARLVVIRVQPTAVIIPIRIEQVQIAVRIVRVIVCITTHRIFSRLNLIRHHNALISRTKFLVFLKYSYSTLSLALTEDILKIKILVVTVTNLGQSHIRPSYFYSSIKKYFKKRPWNASANQGPRTKDKNQKNKKLRIKLAEQRTRSHPRDTTNRQARRKTRPTNGRHQADSH